MMDLSLCGPVIVYIAFSTTQILVDLYRGMYNTSFIKVLVTVILSLTLQVLCEMDLTLIAWMIVFIPFVTMTIFTALLLFVFGTSAITGKEPTYQNVDSSRGKTVVTPTGVNQPYAEGKEVSPGVYTASEVNNLGTFYSAPQSSSTIETFSPCSNTMGYPVSPPSPSSVVENFSELNRMEDIWSSKLNRHIHHQRKFKKYLVAADHSEASVPIKNAN